MNNKTSAAIEILGARYDYETDHVDAASAYDVITDDFVSSTYGIDRPCADSIGFTTKLPPAIAEYTNGIAHWIEDGTLHVSVFIGQDEMDCEIDTDFTDDEIDWIESHSDWIHSNGYWYTAYPDNLSVVATYEIEGVAK